MANLAQISNLRNSARGAALMAIALQVSPLLRALDRTSGWEEGATNFRYRTFAGDTVLGYRAAGNGYTPTLKTPGTPQSGAQKFGGFVINVDQSILADEARGLIDLGPWLDEQIVEEAYSFARDLEKELMRASGSGNAYEGLTTILDGTDLPGFTGITGVLNAKDGTAAADNHFDLTSSSNYDAFVEYLFACIQEVEGAVEMWMAPKLYARMQTIARSQRANGQVIDQFGMPIETFNNVRMIPLLDTSILLTEPDDAGTPVNQTTSIYIVNPGEARFALVSNSGLEIEDYEITEEKQVGKFKAEVRAAWKIARQRSIRRVRNIKV